MKCPKAKRLLTVKEVMRIVNISRSTWWRGVKEGRYPQPIRLGTRTTRWSEEEIMDFISNLTND
jgi:predicted DNA-binding transcriptional regulator AlpA